MSTIKIPGNNDYTIIAIGNHGKYVFEKVSKVFETEAAFHIRTWNKLSEFSIEQINIKNTVSALFLLIPLGDGGYDKFIAETESFFKKAIVPVYSIAIYPFLWEGNYRISQADNFLKALIRISHYIFRINSHQWFPLKEQLGFHKVVDLVCDVATRVLLSLIELQSNNIDIQFLKTIKIAENLEAKRQNSNFWTVDRRD